MTYVYDLILNYNSELYEFYEWEKDDFIYHIKRINMVLVSSNIYNDIYDNIVSFDNDFLLSIYNKCEYYTNRKIDVIPYAFLLTDSYRVMALLLDKTGKVIKYSSLLLDEEEEVLDLCYKLGEIKINYHILKKKNKSEFKTREEKNILNFIKDDLEKSYLNKNYIKLKYLYYEYFNKQSDNVNLIYHELLEEMNKDINKKHYDLYNLIKLSYTEKNA